jgi:hypothetical protein
LLFSPLTQAASAITASAAPSLHMLLMLMVEWSRR